mgnify:CR=1 FL=1|tara:strand:- start:1 stop:294 length:294 start_codon:yes stop_codon:yes gene_type:complete
MSLVDPETNTTKRGPKKKTIKTASLDAVIQLAPMAGEIGEALMYGTGALGAGAVGVMGNKARKLMKKGDEDYRKAISGKNRGGAVMKKRGGTFKGTF